MVLEGFQVVTGYLWLGLGYDIGWMDDGKGHHVDPLSPEIPLQVPPGNSLCTIDRMEIRTSILFDHHQSNQLRGTKQKYHLNINMESTPSTVLHMAQHTAVHPTRPLDISVFGNLTSQIGSAPRISLRPAF